MPESATHRRFSPISLARKSRAPPTPTLPRWLLPGIAESPSTGNTIANHTRACAGETITYESEYRGRVLSTVIGPYRNAAGETIGAVGTSVDFTATRVLERRMVDAQAKTPALQLSLFAVGAGLMAGMLIKRGRIPSRRA